VRRFVTRFIRATKLVVRDGRIPKPLRWLTGIGLIPIPGLKVVLIVIAPLLFAFYRTPMREAWQRAFR
jgi:hypothetical protein